MSTKKKKFIGPFEEQRDGLLNAKNQEISRLQKCVQELETTILGYKSVLSDRDVRITTIRKHIDEGHEELQRLSKGWDAAAKAEAEWENKCLLSEAKCNRFEVLIHMYLEGKLP